ncbi:MAG TPA: response regulator [Galbitalea sp.]|nr:response regulator [Galbitalea sp.]
MSVRVVIADDDADIRQLVMISAAKAGLEVVAEVGDGDAAWEAIVQHVPDLAILDVTMPGVSGLDVCRRVRADSTLASVQVILVSAAAAESSIEAGLAAGATDYLSKPFSPRELAARLMTYQAATR